MRNQSFLWRLSAALVAALALVSLVAPPAGAQGSWFAEYFANTNLSGAPVITRYESALSFDWGNGSPGGGVPSDNFSARWTRTEWFESGTYRFSYRSDDGVRIWVGSTLVVDDWRERQATQSAVDRYIPRGTYTVRVEYYERTGTAALWAAWERISGGAGWRGEYFSNRDLSGSPVLVRTDAAVDFDWGTASPDPAVPADNFSVRWTRTLGFNPGTYRFYASCDDGVRISVDGTRVVDAWYDQRLPNTRSGDITLSSGQHTVVVEYYEHGDKASAHVWWDLLTAFSYWQGRYYDNAELRGGPALIRDDREINFDWGEGAPADWMPADNFSVLWTRQVTFSPGYYKFNVQSDDGVRVWLDGALLMDYWQPQDYVWRYVDGTYLQGPHTLKVEYFERTGSARIRFWWEASGAGGTPVAPVTPAPVTPAPTLPGPWQAEYYNSQSLSGAPVLVRSDAAIDFNWLFGSPAAGVNRDYFSVRWTGAFPFEGGRYKFTTTTDDGVRLYVDERPVINAWRAMRGSRVAYVDVAPGNHTLRMEYFERTQAAMARLTWQRIGPGAVTATPTLPTPAACAGGPLTLQAWPVGTRCVGGGWEATIYVEARGGDCRYTYAWERNVKATAAGSTTFTLWSPTFTAMVGEVGVTSGGQSARLGLYIRPPDSCH
jgi:hypothetical protein